MKYTWNVCFSMKSGNKVEVVYRTDKGSSYKVLEDIVEEMNKNMFSWVDDFEF